MFFWRDEGVEFWKFSIKDGLQTGDGVGGRGKVSRSSCLYVLVAILKIAPRFLDAIDS